MNNYNTIFNEILNFGDLIKDINTFREAENLKIVSIGISPRMNGDYYKAIVVFENNS